MVMNKSQACVTVSHNVNFSRYKWDIVNNEANVCVQSVLLKQYSKSYIRSLYLHYMPGFSRNQVNMEELSSFH